MDFAALPPEINSARMYAGPGPESLQAAAASWDLLAVDLRAAASSYSSVISGLTTAWTGPSSVAMSAAAAPFASWLATTAAQAEQTAGQARAAIAAYETAYAATIPPQVIAANRAVLAELVANNIFGQNAVAIAANEAQYASMWAQDVVAMYGYAGQSAAATRITPFTEPAQNSNPAGTANQAAAVASGLGNRAASDTSSVLSRVMSAAPTALQGLASPAAATDPITWLTDLLNSINSSPLAPIAAQVELLPKLILPANDVMISTIMGLVIAGRRLSDIAVGAAAGAAAAAAPAVPSTAGATAVAASVGQAGMVGVLATPPTWTAATPAIRTVAAVLSSSGHAVSAAAVSEGSLLSNAALAGMAAGAAGTAATRGLAGGGSNGRATMSKDFKTVKDVQDRRSSPGLQRLVAEMAEKPESVQHWHTDSEHLDSLLSELEHKPGIHAVHVATVDKSRTIAASSQQR